MGSTAPRGAYNGSSSAGYGGAGSSGSSAAGAQLGAWADWAARGLELEERAPTQLGKMIGASLERGGVESGELTLAAQNERAIP